jgi:molybdenum cofactor biosynthesis protein B
MALNVAVLTISDTRTAVDDRSGDYLVEQLRAAGHQLAEQAIVRDDKYQIRAIVSRWIADKAVQIILTTGGTGVTGRDGTPEAIGPLLDKPIEGFGELFRMLRRDQNWLYSVAGDRRRGEWHLYFLLTWVDECLPHCLGRDFARSTRHQLSPLQLCQLTPQTPGIVAIHRCWVFPV